MTLPRVERYVSKLWRHDLFKRGDKQKLYDELETLRKLRSRLHIQNLKKDFETLHIEVFNKDRLINAEKVLEIVAKSLLDHYSRPLSKNYIGDFSFPWNEHFTS